MKLGRILQCTWRTSWPPSARIETYTTRGKRNFFAEVIVQDAVIRQLAVIGEAASKVPSGLRAKHRDVPWPAIIGMRNILIHEYSTPTSTRLGGRRTRTSTA